MCQGPICFVSASAFSLVASRLTPKIPPTTGNVITHSSKFAIWLLLLCHATMRRGRPILNAGNTGYRACPDGVMGSAWDIGLRGFLTVQDRVAMRNQVDRHGVAGGHRGDQQRESRRGREPARQATPSRASTTSSAASPHEKNSPRASTRPAAPPHNPELRASGASRPRRPTPVALPERSGRPREWSASA